MRWNDARHPSSPIGLVIHSNWPLPGTVKAVVWASSGCRGICQKLDVKSIVVKIVEPALPMSPMHSLISFIEYLSIWQWLFNSLKSCTILSPCPVFLGTQKIGELYRDCDCLTTPRFNHSCPWFCKVWSDVGLKSEPFFSIGTHGQLEVVEGGGIVPVEGAGHGFDAMHDALGSDGVLLIAVESG